MNYIEWGDQKVKRIGLVDYFFVKIAIIAFALMVAKLINPILSLPWYWYAIIFVLAMIKPLIKIFSKTD